jgi:hypothetical protein
VDHDGDANPEPSTWTGTEEESVMAYTLRIALVTLALFAPVGVLAQPLTATPLTGAWRITEVVRTGTNPVERKTPQPGVLVFTGRHYSLVFVNSNDPRTRLPNFKEPGKPTYGELEAVFRHWDPLTAQAGTYEVNGNTLIMRPAVAKNQNLMDGVSQIREFKIDGNTLTLVERATAGQPAFVTTVKLMREE